MQCGKSIFKNRISKKPSFFYVVKRITKNKIKDDKKGVCVSEGEEEKKKEGKNKGNRYRYSGFSHFSPSERSQVIFSHVVIISPKDASTIVFPV